MKTKTQYINETCYPILKRWESTVNPGTFQVVLFTAERTGTCVDSSTPSEIGFHSVHWSVVDCKPLPPGSTVTLTQ